MGRSLKFLIPLLIFGGIAVFLYRGLSIDPREIPSPLIGKPLPAFDLPRLDAPGERITQKEIMGKVALLNVWATWCVSCRAEHDVLLHLARSGKVPIYGLDWKDDEAGANEWLKRLGNPYVAVAFDKVGRTAIDLGVYGAPETFLIDKKGMIRHKIAGPLSPQLIEEELMPLIRKLNQEG